MHSNSNTAGNAALVVSQGESNRRYRQGPESLPKVVSHVTPVGTANLHVSSLPAAWGSATLGKTRFELLHSRSEYVESGAEAGIRFTDDPSNGWLPAAYCRYWRLLPG